MKEVSKNEIKLLRKLGQRKYREKERLFIAEGKRTVQQILENRRVEVISVFIKEEQAASLGQQHFGIQSIAMEDAVFDEIADTENTQGILALCRFPEELGLESVSTENGIILATDAIQDPGNMGTIIRTAVWFGVKAILAGKGSVDVYHPKVVRSTAGATGSIPIISGDLEEELAILHEKGWEVFLLDGAEKSASLKHIQPSEKTVLVVGNEANGVDEKLLSTYKSVKIEGNSESVESLNAAIAVGIALFGFGCEK